MLYELLNSINNRTFKLYRFIYAIYSHFKLSNFLVIFSIKYLFVDKTYYA